MADHFDESWNEAYYVWCYAGFTRSGTPFLETRRAKVLGKSNAIRHQLRKHSPDNGTRGTSVVGNACVGQTLDFNIGVRLKTSNIKPKENPRVLNRVGKRMENRIEKDGYSNAAEVGAEGNDILRDVLDILM